MTTFSASPAGGTVDPGAGVTPSDGGVTPSNGGITPSDGGVAPSDGGIVPSDGGVVPPDGGVAPSDGGVAPSDGPVTALAESVQRGDVDSAAPKLNDEEMAEVGGAVTVCQGLYRYRRYWNQPADTDNDNYYAFAKCNVFRSDGRH